MGLRDSRKPPSTGGAYTRYVSYELNFKFQMINPYSTTHFLSKTLEYQIFDFPKYFRNKSRVLHGSNDGSENTDIPLRILLGNDLKKIFMILQVLHLYSNSEKMNPNVESYRTLLSSRYSKCECQRWGGGHIPGTPHMR